MAHGDLTYFWLSVPDAERARAFFGGLLGWEFSPGNAPDGFNIENSSPPGGIHGGNERSRANVCFEVDDLKAARARVQGLGGDAGEPQDTEAGQFSLCKDDQGAEFCIWAANSS